jgi:hypothetical protein
MFFYILQIYSTAVLVTNPLPWFGLASQAALPRLVKYRRPRIFRILIWVNYLAKKFFKNFSRICQNLPNDLKVQYSKVLTYTLNFLSLSIYSLQWGIDFSDFSDLSDFSFCRTLDSLDSSSRLEIF